MKKFLITLFVFAVTFQPSSIPCAGITGNEIITTVAGNGTYGFVGDGGSAASASISPGYIAVDVFGNLYISNVYISQTNDYRIRKVDRSGVISTYAGNGKFGFSGDGGPAVSASISFPGQIALDRSGNLYFADISNNRVRRVDTTGIITTIAGNESPGFSGDGGPATQATLSNPNGVAIDSSGNLYIGDTGNNRVRRVNPQGIITTVAGDGFFTTPDIIVCSSGMACIAIVPIPSGRFSGDGGPATLASLDWPTSIVVDRFGNIYITDNGNIRIRKVDGTGIITTIAGNGNSGYSGDGGAATLAGLNFPGQIAVNAYGDLYIADSFNSHRIRKVNSAGIITTVAGNGSFGFSGDGGPATSSQLWNPFGVAVSNFGNLYISDAGSSRVRIVTADPLKDFSNLSVYPSPYKPSVSGHTTAGITIFGVPANASVNLYTLTGNLVKQLKDEDGDGVINWDARNENGQDFASGVYFGVVEEGGKSKVIKIAIQR